MNPLKEKFLDFKTLNQYTFKYLLLDGNTICYKITQQQFPHLIGLHKLVDIPLILKFNDPTNSTVSASFILSKIKKEELTDADIRASRFYATIQNRYEYLSRETILSLSFNKVIVDFDNTKVATKLNSQYIFIESRDSGYLHLGIIKHNDEYYPETFFFDSTDYYSRNQKVVKIKAIQIFDERNTLQLEEVLIQ